MTLKGNTDFSRKRARGLAFQKILIIGIDGGTFDLIGPWTSDGYLPNISKLFDEGVRCTLNSTIPPVTSPAWPSFMTGMNPGKHGVFDFIRSRGTGYDMVSSTSIKQPTMWDRLSDAGIRVGVINVPITYPPKSLKDGFMISGLPFPSTENICFPRELIDRYSMDLGLLRLAPEPYVPGNEKEFIDNLDELVRSQGRYTLALMENESWDLMMIVFNSVDAGSHFLWHYMDEEHPKHEPDAHEGIKNALRDLYGSVDSEIGKLITAAPDDTTVMLLSDHGFGPLHYSINLNVLLMNAGLLCLKRSPITRLKSLLFNRGITPQAIYNLIQPYKLSRLLGRLSKEKRNAMIGKFLSYNDIDWTRTQAYSMGHVGQIYINTKGIRPFGIVEPGTEREAVCNNIIDNLSELRHPFTGKPILTRVVRSEEVFNGPFSELGPDIQVILDDYRCISFPLFSADHNLFSSQIRGDSGCHRREGIFIAKGPGIRHGVTRSPAEIIDVAPTVMYLMGLGVPTEMDGQPMIDILQDPFEVIYNEEASHIVNHDGGLTDEETAAIEKRLQELGYLE